VIYNWINTRTKNFEISDNICTDKKLLQLLITLKENDQKYRKIKREKTKIEWEEQKSIDSFNRNILDSVLHSGVTLNASTIGSSGVKIAYLITQHSDDNPMFQHKLLGELSKEYSYSGSNLSSYAMLIDRYNFNTEGVQFFGTQLHYYKVDSLTKQAIPEIICLQKYVHILRDYFNLPPLDFYIKDMTEYVNRN
jgi:hypothetical protein